MENPIILGTLVGSLLFGIIKLWEITRLKLAESEIRKLRLAFADELDATADAQKAQAARIRDEVRRGKSPLASIGNFIQTTSVQECAT